MARKTAQALTIGIMLAATGNHELLADPQDAQAAACAARQTVPTQIRPLDCGSAASVAQGMTRSATFRRLIEKVGELKGIVYIKGVYYVNLTTRRVQSGALSHHISTAGSYRVLHLMVAPESGDRRLTTMAHELQHAIEVLEATGVTTDAAVDRLFERIGMHVSAGVSETQAALDVENAVLRELLANR